MDDLIAQIAEKTGVTVSQARDGVTLAVTWIKDRLPDDLNEQVAGALSEAGAQASGLVGKAVDAGGSAASAAEAAAGGAWEKAKGVADDLMPGGE